MVPSVYRPWRRSKEAICAKGRTPREPDCGDFFEPRGPGDTGGGFDWKHAAAEACSSVTEHRKTHRWGSTDVIGTTVSAGDPFTRTSGDVAEPRSDGLLGCGTQDATGGDQH